MSASIFIPSTSTLAPIQSSNISSMRSLLDAVWEKYLRLDRVKLPQLSLRTLTNPVPIEPMDTLHKRVMDSARGSGWAHTAIKGEVPSRWCDSKNVHVFLYVDQGIAMQAAENLYEKLWGQNVDHNLKVLSGDGGGTWKYLPKEYLDFLQLPLLGYLEDVLLFREEYSAAMKSFDPEEAMETGCRGVVVTGQPGIGKSCFLYYLLLQQLSKKTPVALEQPDCFFLFSDDGVTMHAKTSYPRLFPKITWALSDSNENMEHPCDAFLDGSQQRHTWVVQATSPLEKRWKNWEEQYLAGVFIMKYFSVEEITALGKILGLDVGNLQRIYNQWGPSTRLCLRLSRNPDNEDSHKNKVIIAAAYFIEFASTTSPVDTTTVTRILFKMEPKGVTKELRQTPIEYIATDQIKDIILYAAAEADTQQRTRFYFTISKQPGFRTAAGKMFKEFVLSWLYTHSEGYLPCDAAKDTSPPLQIPACGDEHRGFFGSKSALKTTMRGKTLPLLLLPTSQSFATADAIVLTEEFIITIQVTIANRHTVDPGGLAIIEEYLPGVAEQSKRWCHVFITDKENKAISLRSQTLSDLPSQVQIYSAIFNVGTPSIRRKHVEEFNNQMQCELRDQQGGDADMEVE